MSKRKREYEKAVKRFRDWHSKFLHDAWDRAFYDAYFGNAIIECGTSVPVIEE